MMYKQGVVVRLGRFLGVVAVGGRYLGTSMVIILVELSVFLVVLFVPAFVLPADEETQCRRVAKVGQKVLKSTIEKQQ